MYMNVLYVRLIYKVAISIVICKRNLKGDGKSGVYSEKSFRNLIKSNLNQIIYY